MFTVTGRLPGSRTTRAVTWDEGELRGDPILVELLRLEAETSDGYPIGPNEGPYTMRDHLRSDSSTLALLHTILAPGTVSFAGKRPERPEIPDGAIG